MLNNNAIFLCLFLSKSFNLFQYLQRQDVAENAKPMTTMSVEDGVTYVPKTSDNKE